MRNTNLLTLDRPPAVRWWVIVAVVVGNSGLDLALMVHHVTELKRIPLDLVYLFALGVLFSVVYLSTSNLFVAMAVHAVFHSPALICAVPNSLALTTVIVVTMVVVVPLALPQRVRAQRRTPQP